MSKIDFTDTPYKKEYSTGEHVRRVDNPIDNPILISDKTLKTNRYCDKCSNNPSNGGSGICNCILGQPHIT